MKNKKENFSIEDIYTPLSVAKEEIWRRWNDKELRKKVEDFLEGDVPAFLQDTPKAVIARNIASPNHEFLRYLDLSKTVNLEPKCLEYLDDKFRSENIDKYSLGKPFFYEGLGKKGGEKGQIYKIINYDIAEGKKFCEINTLWGESLVDFHHKLLCSISPENSECFIDMSKWVNSHGKNPSEFYIKYLALFLCNGILFENFITKTDKMEADFTNEIVMPSINNLINIFGIKPIIVALNPLDEESNMYFRYYPKELRVNMQQSRLYNKINF